MVTLNGSLEGTIERLMVRASLLHEIGSYWLVKVSGHIVDWNLRHVDWIGRREVFIGRDRHGVIWVVRIVNLIGLHLGGRDLHRAIELMIGLETSLIGNWDRDETVLGRGFHEGTFHASSCILKIWRNVWLELLLALLKNGHFFWELLLFSLFDSLIQLL